MSFFAALGFLTIVPVPRRRAASADRLGQSLTFFPVVGLVIGLTIAGLNWLLGLFLPAAVVYALLLIALVVVSGGLHLDGFADTCDGIAGHRSAEERLRIMRDSRIGAFGVIGIVLLLLLKYVLLTAVPQSLLASTLIFMPVASRWAIVFAVVAYPYARSAGLGRAFKQGATWPRCAIATVITLALGMVLTLWADMRYFYLVAPAIMLGTWLVTLGTATYLSRKLSGLTGDTYGAICELAEVTVLIMVVLLTRNQWLGMTG